MQKIDFSRLITIEVKARAAQEAQYAQIRQRRECAISSGITLAGMDVQTDDLSQQRILGAAVAVLRDPSLIIRWKTADGAFVSLDATAVLAVADAIRAHVQACFERERELLDAFHAGSPVDLDAGWPAKTL